MINQIGTSLNVTAPTPDEAGMEIASQMIQSMLDQTNVDNSFRFFAGYISVCIKFLETVSSRENVEQLLKNILDNPNAQVVLHDASQLPPSGSTLQ